MKKTLIFLFFIFYSLCYSIEYSDTITNFSIVKVRDGDTFVINIKNVPDVFGKDIAVRIRGIDTPELHTKNEEIKKKAIQAKNELEKLLKNAKSIILYNIGRDKYFRILASVKVDNIDIAEYMIKKGLAEKYDGGKKNSVYGLEYEDTVENEHYKMQVMFSEYLKLFYIEIETIDTSYNTFYTISTIDYVDGFDIELKAKNDEYLFYEKGRFRSAIKQDNGKLNLEFRIFNYNFYLLNYLYDWLKKNTITAITFIGDDYKETVDIKYYKDFQKNLISMLENINNMDEFLN